MADLAIIIPAYKDTFLDETICSISAQTCKDFTLYIGDDCSPYNIEKIVEAYKDKINIVYKRFEINYGKDNLVAQWERCISMSKEEKWIWLFSDDDVMEPNCVEAFYDEIKKQHMILPFNVIVIDDKSHLKYIPATYPKVISSYEFIRKNERENNESC